MGWLKRLLRLERRKEPFTLLQLRYMETYEVQTDWYDGLSWLGAPPRPFPDEPSLVPPPPPPRRGEESQQWNDYHEAFRRW